MASGEPQASIGGLLPASASSSQAPSDLIRETTPSVENAWSEIVRGAVRSRVMSLPDGSQPTQFQETRRHSSSPHTRVAGSPNPVLLAVALTSSSSPVSASVPAKFQQINTGSSKNPSSVSLDSVTGFVDAPPTLISGDIGSPQIEKTPAVRDTVSETHTASPQGSAKHAQPSPARSLKPAWVTPATKTGENLEPEPVMGAISWPALSEAHNMKSFEPAKSGTQRSSRKQSSPSSSDNCDVKAPHSLKEELGTNRGLLSSQKSTNLLQVVGNGNISTDSTSSNAFFPVKVTRIEDSGQFKRPGSRESKIGAVVDSTAPNRRNAASPICSITPDNNVLGDHGRGNQGWLPHGRGYYPNSIHGYANSSGNSLLPQHQWATHKNLQQPFFNSNLGFVHAAGYPGNIYYVPTPPPEPLLGDRYFVPPVPGVSQGVMTPGSDAMTLKRMVLHQIEYYFSVENLCRDMYLRSNMDAQGFVPISLIANFNRVQKITQNLFFIIEALQASNGLEVQVDIWRTHRTHKLNPSFGVYTYMKGCSQGVVLLQAHNLVKRGSMQVER